MYGGCIDLNRHSTSKRILMPSPRMLRRRTVCALVGLVWMLGAEGGQQAGPRGQQTCQQLTQAGQALQPAGRGGTGKQQVVACA